MKPTAILLLHCPDQQGIITEITKFITDNLGNIVYLDQYVDREDGVFFMRIEWELDKFLIPREKIKEYIVVFLFHSLSAPQYKFMWETMSMNDRYAYTNIKTIDDERNVTLKSYIL